MVFKDIDSMTPNSCEALVVHQEGDAAPKLVKQSIPIPTPGDNQLLVRVTHVAQNPTDGTLRSSRTDDTPNR